MELKRGINLGGYLSQCVHSMEHYKSFIGEEDIKRIADWGFDHVRLPIDYEVLENEDGSEREEGYQFVYNTVDWCMKYKLNIILDLHKAPGYDFNHAGNSAENNFFTSEALQNRFVNLWVNIVKHFWGYDNVAFELLNEVVEKDNVELWNALIKRTVTAIRKIAKSSPIIYGGIQWNSATTLKYLEKPLDKNIIFTFHFYEPLLFTHQKAHWVEKMDKKKDVFYPDDMETYKEESAKLGEQGLTVSESTAADIGEEFLEQVVEAAITAAADAGVSLYCGEFGVIDQAPVEDTLRWFTTVDEVFKKHQIGFAVWSYKEMDFGITESHYDDIREPLLTLWNK